MTKEEIIKALKESAKPDTVYFLDDETKEAMLQYPNPIEFVEPVLEIIGTNPSVDFGMPGDLVRFVESFYKKGYEEMLISSVDKNPTAHNIWMVHRCYNDLKNPLHDDFRKLIESVRNRDSITESVKRTIDEFSW